MKKKKINADAALLEVARRHHTKIKNHRESPPITMRLLWLPFITSSML